MSIEPLASNRDRFNFWFLPETLASETGLLGDAGELTVLGQLGLPNVQVTALYSELDGTSDARTTSFFGQRELSGLDDVGFGGVRVAVDLDQPVAAAPTLAHEWGHGIFDLRDEYYGFDDRPILNQFPNCAPDIGTAADLWGDHLGQVDPFVYEVLQARTDAGLPVDTFDHPLPEQVRIGIIEGGCYGPLGGVESFRPSADSLMNSELRVFGAVNRARVEEISATFTGRGEIEDPDDLVLSCTTRQSWLTCEGQLRSHLDPPTSGISVGTLGCTFTTGAERSAAPVGVSCSGPAPPGQHVTVSLGLKRDRVEVVSLDLPESTSRADQMELAALVAGPGENPRASSVQPGSLGDAESMTRFWLTLTATSVAAGVLLIAAKRLGGAEPPT